MPNFVLTKESSGIGWWVWSCHLWVGKSIVKNKAEGTLSHELCGTRDEAPAPCTGDPRALLVVSAHFPCYKELFSVFFVVSSACMHIPLGILALTAELIPSAWSSHSTVHVRYSP